jgi:hypothetical protein
MSHPFARALRLAGLVLIVGIAPWSMSMTEARIAAPHYLRVSIGHWKIDTHSQEAERIFRQIETEGVAVFRAQPGFVRYRLMRENTTTTIAVAEWESETLGLAGAQQYRAWMQRVGIMDRLELETHTGQIVAGSN